MPDQGPHFCHSTSVRHFAFSVNMSLTHRSDFMPREYTDYVGHGGGGGYVLPLYETNHIPCCFFWLMFV
jgi:hypothetical protein